MNDKIYLPSIEEMLETSYGFSSNEKEGDTRRLTDFVGVGGTPKKPFAGAMVYWLRSPGMAKGQPAATTEQSQNVQLAVKTG